MDDINKNAIRAAGDPVYLEDFIQQNESFILRCASAAVHRFITKSDDEWSVALLAFSQAVREYSREKGGFPGFARIVIQRRLIDYLRTEAKHSPETSVSPSVLDSDPEEGEEDAAVGAAVLSRADQSLEDSLRLEIESAGQVFSAYGFSFYDLAGCSPKAEKTKKACARAAAYLIRSPLLVSDMRASKTLPLKTIEKGAEVPRKILERHRKYIIAAVEIITGDYPFLADYMRFIREELDR